MRQTAAVPEGAWAEAETEQVEAAAVILGETEPVGLEVVGWEAEMAVAETERHLEVSTAEVETATAYREALGGIGGSHSSRG